MLGFLAFTTINTVQAAHNFQQQYNAIKTGNVKAIRPWMTIHVISHTYHVPEGYLGRSLNENNPTLLHHATLYEIAHREKQPVDKVTHTIQHAILVYHHRANQNMLLTYRQSRFQPPLPPLVQYGNTEPLITMLIPGRVNY
jgi:hypothetical protein